MSENDVVRTSFPFISFLVLVLVSPLLRLSPYVSPVLVLEFSFAVFCVRVGFVSVHFRGRGARFAIPNACAACCILTHIFRLGQEKRRGGHRLSSLQASSANGVALMRREGEGGGEGGEEEESSTALASFRCQRTCRPSRARCCPRSAVVSVQEARSCCPRLRGVTGRGWMCLELFLVVSSTQDLRYSLLTSFPSWDSEENDRRRVEGGAAPHCGARTSATCSIELRSVP